MTHWRSRGGTIFDLEERPATHPLGSATGAEPAICCPSSSWPPRTASASARSRTIRMDPTEAQAARRLGDAGNRTRLTARVKALFPARRRWAR